ncbi:MAG: hypothetical protein GY820_10735, partial [Gammaproteobacteria bacterium]|nr:hypothetical protein [Gammaproteobacteria bacterium]
MRMVGSIEDICTLEYGYRSYRGQWYPETGMELPVVAGRNNPLFIEHIQDRFSFLCMKSRMEPTVEFRQRYSLKWDNDQLYATPQDLVVHIMDQYEKVVPTRGDVNAYQLTNTFSTLFGTSLGECINSKVIDRTNLLDGIDDLKVSLANSGSRRLALYVQKYDGPRGTYPLREGLEMPAEHEEVLRKLHFSVPAKDEEPYAIYMVLCAMHGHPVFFRLSDFVTARRAAGGDYRMCFPTELKELLETCHLIVWGKEETIDLLDNTFNGSPGWNYRRVLAWKDQSVAED